MTAHVHPGRPLITTPTARTVAEEMTLVTSLALLALASVVATLVSVYNYEHGNYKIGAYAEALAALIASCSAFSLRASALVARRSAASSRAASTAADCSAC